MPVPVHPDTPLARCAHCPAVFTNATAADMAAIMAHEATHAPPEPMEHGLWTPAPHTQSWTCGLSTDEFNRLFHTGFTGNNSAVDTTTTG